MYTAKRLQRSSICVDVQVAFASKGVLCGDCVTGPCDFILGCSVHGFARVLLLKRWVSLSFRLQTNGNTCNTQHRGNISFSSLCFLLSEVFVSHKQNAVFLTCAYTSSPFHITFVTLDVDSVPAPPPSSGGGGLSHDYLFYFIAVSTHKEEALIKRFHSTLIVAVQADNPPRTMVSAPRAQPSPHTAGRFCSLGANNKLGTSFCHKPGPCPTKHPVRAALIHKVGYFLKISRQLFE